MRRFCYKTWVKVCAMILCILSINAAAGSVFFMGAGAEFGVYRGTKEEIKEEKIQEYIRILEMKSQRLKKLTEDLIEASKVSSGNVKLNIEEIKLKELI